MLSKIITISVTLIVEISFVADKPISETESEKTEELGSGEIPQTSWWQRKK